MPWAAAREGAHLGEHRGPVHPHRLASHDVGPQRAGIVDVDVDVARRQGVERHHRPERLHLGSRPAGLALDPLTQQMGQDVLFGEPLGADCHWTTTPGQERRGQGEARVEVEGRHRRHDDTDSTPSARAHAGLEGAHQPVEQHGQGRRRDAPDQHRTVVPGLQSAEDVVAKARCADRRRQRRDADGPDRGGPDAGHDDRHGERQLDATQLLRRGHSHRARRFPQRGVHSGDAGHGVPQHRQHAVQGQPDERRRKPILCSPSDARQRHHDGEQRQTRYRLDDPGHAEGGLLEPPHARDRHAQWQAHRRAAEQRQERQLEMGRQIRRQQRQLFGHLQTGLRPEPHAVACGGPYAPRRAREARMCAPWLPHAAPQKSLFVRSPVQSGLRPNPTRSLAGPLRPAPRPRGAHVRALAPSRRAAEVPLRSVACSVGATPRTPRGRLRGPLRPAPRPRGAHVRALAPSRRAAEVPLRSVVCSVGATPRTPRGRLRGSLRPAPRPRGAHVRAFGLFSRGCAPNPTPLPGTPKPPVNSSPSRAATRRAGLRAAGCPAAAARSRRPGRASACAACRSAPDGPPA